MHVDIRHHALGALTAILLFGTAYSVLYHTYLDTSNPLLTSLPHPLSKTHTFATKSNPLNTIFIKRAWGWTSLSFFSTFFTGPSGIRTRDRIFKFLTLTAIWILFVNWFFGPAILERVIVYSGGECIASMPSGEHVTVPNDLCFTRATLTPQTHPKLFNAASFSSSGIRQLLSIKPRLRKGHDLSGHVFLLTVSILFLVDQLRPSFSQRVPRTLWSSLHVWAIATQVVLISIWLFSLYTTALYFHTPLEKFTGYGEWFSALYRHQKGLHWLFFVRVSSWNCKLCCISIVVMEIQKATYITMNGVPFNQNIHFLIQIWHHGNRAYSDFVFVNTSPESTCNH